MACVAVSVYHPGHHKLTSGIDDSFGSVFRFKVLFGANINYSIALDGQRAVFYDPSLRIHSDYMAT
jgi:hypothetical protein